MPPLALSFGTLLTVGIIRLLLHLSWPSISNTKTALQVGTKAIHSQASNQVRFQVNKVQPVVIESLCQIQIYQNLLNSQQEMRKNTNPTWFTNNSSKKALNNVLTNMNQLNRRNTSRTF